MTPEEIADQIMAELHHHTLGRARNRIAAAIREAEAKHIATIEALRRHNDYLKAYAPPAGHVLTPDGVVRKCLGELPITKDGVVVTVGHDVYHPNQNWSMTLTVFVYCEGFANDDDFPMPDDCEYVANYSYYEHETGYGEHETYDIRECYSTRAAAEAASKAKQEPAQ